MKILGINFFDGNVHDVVSKLRSGGLLVVPAAPALATVKEDPFYYRSLLHADIVIADSGYMTLLWNIRHRRKVNRISGLEFLEAFLDESDIQKNARILVVNPSEEESASNINYLQQRGFETANITTYTAPYYKKEAVEDASLLAVAENLQPQYILINLGGGTQEKLGAWLRENLSFTPGIICTGAAIAFLTGKQVKIPMWADKLFLGWLFRCIDKPSVYIPRYFGAFRITPMILFNRRARLVLS